MLWCHPEKEEEEPAATGELAMRLSVGSNAAYNWIEEVPLNPMVRNPSLNLHLFSQRFSQ